MFVIVGAESVSRIVMPVGNQRRRWFVAFLAALAACGLVNLVAVGLRSDAGLLEGLGLMDRSHDDIRRVGFPIQFYEEGGFAYRKIFSFGSLVWDVVLAVGFAIGAGFVATWRPAPAGCRQRRSGASVSTQTSSTRRA
jgi:hypothetical protein